MLESNSSRLGKQVLDKATTPRFSVAVFTMQILQNHNCPLALQLSF